MSYKNAKKKLDQIVNSFNLDEMIESIKDNLNHFEELDILKGYNLSISTDFNKNNRDCAIPFLSLDSNIFDEGKITGQSNKLELDLTTYDGLEKFIENIENSELIELMISVIVKSNRDFDNKMVEGLDYLKSICKIDGIELTHNLGQLQNWNRLEIEIFFIKSEKTSKFIEDPFEKLPSHLVTKFKEFAKKYDLKMGGKKDLVNLFRSSNI